MWVSKHKHNAEVTRLQDYLDLASESAASDRRWRAKLENAVTTLYPDAPTYTGNNGVPWLDSVALVKRAEAVKRARQVEADEAIRKEVDK